MRRASTKKDERQRDREISEALREGSRKHMSSHVLLMFGLPGSGRSTLFRNIGKLARRPDTTTTSTTSSSSTSSITDSTEPLTAHKDDEKDMEMQLIVADMKQVAIESVIAISRECLRLSEPSDIKSESIDTPATSASSSSSSSPSSLPTADPTVMKSIREWSLWTGDEEDIPLDKELAARIGRWWTDELVSYVCDIIAKRTELFRDCRYVLRKINLLADPDYEVTSEDISRFRSEMRRSVETMQIMWKDALITVNDCTTACFQARKRLSLFCTALSVVFVVDLSSFDQFCRPLPVSCSARTSHAESTTRAASSSSSSSSSSSDEKEEELIPALDAALQYFGQIVAAVGENQLFYLVLLTQLDEFKKKVESVPFSTYDPTLTWDDESWERDVSERMREKFNEELMRNAHGDCLIFMETVADCSSEESVQKCWEAIREHLQNCCIRVGYKKGGLMSD